MFPETCVPTCTVTTALGLPVAEMVYATLPLSTGTVRYSMLACPLSSPQPPSAAKTTTALVHRRALRLRRLMTPLASIYIDARSAAKVSGRDHRRQYCRPAAGRPPVPAEPPGVSAAFSTAVTVPLAVAIGPSWSGTPAPRAFRKSRNSSATCVGTKPVPLSSRLDADAVPWTGGGTSPRTRTRFASRSAGSHLITVAYYGYTGWRRSRTSPGKKIPEAG